MKIHLISNCIPTNSKTQTLNGIEYLIVPGIPVQEQVMNSFFVPADEIAHFVGGWNGIPITVNHPKANDGSANVPTPDVSVIGRFYNAAFDEVTKRLSGEYWIDINAAKASIEGAAILKNVNDGMMLEQSTGYYADVDETAGACNGVPYIGIHRNLVPDHIAILLNSEGACSLSDGCGINRNGSHVCANEKECPLLKINALSKARTPKYSGTETVSWAGVDKTMGAYIEAWKKAGGKMPGGASGQMMMKDMPAECINFIASKTLLGDPSSSSPNDMMVFPVVNPTTDKLNQGALQAVMSGRGSQASIPASALESARGVAQSLLSKEFSMKGKANMKKLKANELLALLDKAGVKGLKLHEKEEGETDEGALFEIDGEALEMPTAAAGPEDNEDDEAPVANEDKPLFTPEEMVTLKTLLTTAPEIIKGLPAAVEMAQNARAELEGKKRNLIATIKANKANVYADDELASMTLPVLTKLNGQLNVNYSGFGLGIFENANEDAALPIMPSILLAPAAPESESSKED